MDQEKFYVEIGQDLPNVLQDSEVLIKALRTELAKEGIEAEIDWNKDPNVTGNNRDVVLVILAVGVASVLVSHAVKKVIDALNGETTASEEVVVDAKIFKFRSASGKAAEQGKST